LLVQLQESTLVNHRLGAILQLGPETLELSLILAEERTLVHVLKIFNQK
jgi:hypothetical protein